MNRADLTRRVRSYTRDLTSSIFRSVDITDYINEGIDRFRSYIPKLKGMTWLTSDDSPPILLPDEYHYMLAVYGASRCFAQDERHYQASTLMNEFESKLEELNTLIQDGTVVIKTADGTSVETTIPVDYVTVEYFADDTDDSDIDDGVNGVS